MLRWFRRPLAAAERTELKALRHLVIELLSDAARRAPDPAGYLESRRAGIAVAGADTATLRLIDRWLGEARPRA